MADTSPASDGDELLRRYTNLYDEEEDLISQIGTGEGTSIETSWGAGQARAARAKPLSLDLRQDADRPHNYRAAGHTAGRDVEGVGLEDTVRRSNRGPLGSHEGYFDGQHGQCGTASGSRATRRIEASDGDHSAAGNPGDPVEGGYALTGRQRFANAISSDPASNRTTTAISTEVIDLTWSESNGAGPSTTTRTTRSSSQSIATRRTNRRHRCDYSDCDKAYAIQSELNKHQRYHMRKEQWPIFCPHCPERFLFQKDLVRHLQGRQHDASPQFQCLQCFRMFTRADNLARHRKGHSRNADASESFQKASSDLWNSRDLE